MSAHNNDDHNQYDEQYPAEYDQAYDDQPVDDAVYSDDTSSDAITDDWSDDLDETIDDENASPPPKKKKSKLTTLIIIVVAIIGVLGFLVMKGGNKAGQEATAPTEDVAAIPVENQPPQQPDNALASLKDGTSEEADQAAIQQAPAPINDQPAQGLMDNPSLVDQSAPTPAPAPAPMTAPTADAPPVPTTSAPAPTEQPVPQLQSAAPSGLAETITPNVKPVSDFPTVDSIKKQDTVPALAETPVATPPATLEQAPAPTPTEPVAQEQPAPVPPESMALKSLQDQMAEANAKISELQKNLADKDAELQNQKAQAAPATAEVQDLKSKIAELENRLASAASTASSDRAEAPQPRATKAIQKQTTKPQAVTTPVLKKTNWALKSARPGRAVIADKTTGDYKTVSVGDTVKGLGKITSITESSSGWTVTGTQGKVSE